MSDAIIGMLRGMGVPMPEGGEAPTLRKSPPEILVKTLNEYFADYATGCKFKPGDLVTPKKGGPLPDSGDPFIVVEVFKEPIRMLGRSDKLYHVAFGARADIRILRESEGVIVANVGESWMYEPWQPKVDTDKPAN